MNSTVRAILVDDDEEDHLIAERLTRLSPDKLECTPMKPSGRIEDLIKYIDRLVNDNKCHLLLLDYRLDYMPSEHPVFYRGGGLAAMIRDRIPNLPLVLVTTRDWYQELLAPTPSLYGLFDHVVFKHNLADQRQRSNIVFELTDLVIGFRLISESSPLSWCDMARLLDIESKELRLLAEFEEPPIGVGKVADWLLNRLLKYPGLLIDENYAAAVLGIDLSSFLGVEIQKAISDYRYHGPFGEWQRRWWHYPLDDWLNTLDRDSDRMDNESAERATKIARVVNVQETDILPAECSWCEGHEVIRICIVCQKPVDPMHALGVVEDRPYWTDRPVVCYTCIQSGQDGELYYQFGTKLIVEDLRSGDLKPESDND